MPYYPAVVDPYARYGWGAPDHGLLAQNFPAEMATSGIVMPTAGQVRVVRIRLPVTSSVTNIIMNVTTVGNTLTTGQCFAGLYTSAGVKIAVTADQAVPWVSTGIKTAALAAGPFTCVAADYYVAFWFNGTTGPSFASLPSPAAVLANLGRATPNLFWGSADTGITTTSPDPLGAQTVSGNAYWVGLS